MSENFEQAENKAENATEQVEADELQSEQAETDWKAESRKWEKLAKKNRDAATELEQLKQAQLTEQERLQQRVEKAEAELSRLNAENERLEAAREVATKSGVPQELLAFCADRDAMEEFVAIYGERTHKPSAPKTQSTRIMRESDTPVSNRDVFAEMAANAFSK